MFEKEFNLISINDIKISELSYEELVDKLNKIDNKLIEILTQENLIQDQDCNILLQTQESLIEEINKRMYIYSIENKRRYIYSIENK